jgi:hypothetical protein
MSITSWSSTSGAASGTQTARYSGPRQFILADSGARVVFCTNEATYDVLESMRARLPELRSVIGVSRPDGAPGSGNDLRAIGAAHPVAARRATISSTGARACVPVSSQRKRARECLHEAL